MNDLIEYNCPSEEEIWELIDGELPQEKRTAIQKHIEKCPPCKIAFNNLVSFDKNLSTALLHQEQPSCFFSEKLAHRIEIEMKGGSYRPLLRAFWKRLVITTFATMLAALVVITVVFPENGKLPFEQEIKNFNQLVNDLLGVFHHADNSVIMLSIVVFWILFGLDRAVFSKQKTVL